MTLLGRLFAYFTFFIILEAAFGQTYQYKLTGSYPLNSQSLSPQTVNFQMQWNEIGEKIEGLYTDNYTQISTPIIATQNNAGKTFVVTFPAVTNGFKQVKMLFQNEEAARATIPVSVTTSDEAGVTLLDSSITAVFEAPESNSVKCEVGFGELSGYCGLYAGTFTETSDTLGYCNLDSPRLELNASTHVLIKIAPAGNHDLGLLPLSPLSDSVVIKSRNCGILPGTSFPPNNCQNLTLDGTFSEENGDKTFTGTYTLMDEQSRNTCTYNVSLTRTLPYK